MDNPFHTKGLRHGTNDPRGLLERIEAQLGERIEEAVEMTALELLVELRKRHQRPAPARLAQATLRKLGGSETARRRLVQLELREGPEVFAGTEGALPLFVLREQRLASCRQPRFGRIQSITQLRQVADGGRSHASL